MYRAPTAVILASMLFPVSAGFSAEVSDTAPTLSVLITGDSEFVYRDAEGYTVVVGQLVNNNEQTAVSGIRLGADFYDDSGTTPLESVVGGSVLDVVPPLGTTPFVIRSASADPAITQVSVSLLGFDSSTSKTKGLEVRASDMLYTGGMLSFSGVLQNGAAFSSDVMVHVAFYDSFDPPRIIDVRSVHLGTVPPNDTVRFEFREETSQRAVGFYLFSESGVFYSDFADLAVPEPTESTKLVTIKSVEVLDDGGSMLSVIPVGSTVNIRSETHIEFSAEQPTDETPYTYFVQIKRLGQVPFAEFVGKYDGRYIGTGVQYQSIDWIPESPGEFFIETFVWDRNNIPIAEQGPFVLISVK